MKASQEAPRRGPCNISGHAGPQQDLEDAGHRLQHTFVCEIFNVVLQSTYNNFSNYSTEEYVSEPLLWRHLQPSLTQNHSTTEQDWRKQKNECLATFPSEPESWPEVLLILSIKLCLFQIRTLR